MRLGQAAGDDAVEIILELKSPGDQAAASAALPGDPLTVRRAAFEAWSDSVAESVSQCGGTVVERAWINSTLRARVPASRVSELAENDKIDRIGLATVL